MPIVPELGYDPIRKPFLLGEHEHPYFELTYISNGNATWALPERSLQLVGGTFALTQPNVRHRGEWNFISPCTLFWFHVDLSQGTEHSVFDSGDLRQFQSVLSSFGDDVGRASPEFRRLMTEWESVLRRSSSESGVAFMSSARAMVCQIIAQLVQDITLGPRYGASSSIATEMERFLKNSLTEEVSLSHLAESVGLSQRSAIKHFKQAFGQTPMDYLRRLRCQAATEYLRQTNRSVTDIAFSLGFHSSQNFAKVFKRYTNMTPSQYRKTNGR
jgi:AraC-like DNA-binding protein